MEADSPFVEGSSLDRWLQRVWTVHRIRRWLCQSLLYGFVGAGLFYSPELISVMNPPMSSSDDAADKSDSGRVA